jgi:hypothetical protein
VQVQVKHRLPRTSTAVHHHPEGIAHPELPRHPACRQHQPAQQRLMLRCGIGEPRNLQFRETMSAGISRAMILLKRVDMVTFPEPWTKPE